MTSIDESAARNDADAPRFKGRVVPAARSTVRILRYLSAQPQAASLTEVARALDLVPSTCFHLLQTLAREGFVAFDHRRKEYALGYGAVDIARGSAVIGGDVHLVRSILEEVAREHDATVTLWRPVTREQLMLVMSAFGQGNVSIHMSIGQRVPLLTGAAGRIMAAFLNAPKRELRAQFRQVRWACPFSFDKFMAEAAEAKRLGWAVDKGVLITGTAAIAVPIFTAQGEIAMACAATLLIDRASAKLAARIARSLMAASLKIRELAPEV